MIPCDQHDYIEIACMFHLAVEVQLVSGDTYQGIANNIVLNTHKQECLELRLSHKQSQLIALTDLNRLTAEQANPHFSTINFS